MRYPDDEVPDRRRRNDEVAEECRPPDDADGKRCASCGVEIDPTHRHPAAVVPHDPSTVYLFCDDDCRTAWLDERGNDRRGD
ncbi:DUF7576 family protein [Halogeometricum pallidum]|nr:hypothetical protein [Halogeometricum pallidum]